jgi:hypothetical protein
MQITLKYNAENFARVNKESGLAVNRRLQIKTSVIMSLRVMPYGRMIQKLSSLVCEQLQTMEGMKLGAEAILKIAYYYSASKCCHAVQLTKCD